MLIFVSYIIWHYTIALKDIIKITRNFLIGTWHKFAISIHFRTLFTAWKRQDLPKEKQDNPFAQLGENILDAIINGYLRILAAIIRLSIIISGLVVELFIGVSFVLIMFIWIFWPVIIVAWMIRGITLL